MSIEVVGRRGGLDGATLLVNHCQEAAAIRKSRRREILGDVQIRRLKHGIADVANLGTSLMIETPRARSIAGV